MLVVIEWVMIDCDRAIVLNDGKIIFDDKMENLYLSEKTLEIASLRETSIQTFAKYHNIDSKKFGALLKKTVVEEGDNEHK